MNEGARADADSEHPLLRELMNLIDKSVTFKGELISGEDLAIEGRVEGKVELKDYLPTLKSNGKIKAEVFAKTLIVMGEIDGAIVKGHVVAPRVAIEEGAYVRGSVEMQRQVGRQRQESQQQRRPA